MDLTERKPDVSTYWLMRIGFGSIIVAIIIGVLFAVVAQWLDLIILYPLLMGVFAGMFVAFGSERLQVNNRLVMFALGVLLGLLIYGTYRYTDYLLFVRKVEADSSKPASITFDQYLRLSAKLGFSITSVTDSSDKPVALNEPLTWAFWGLELLCATIGGGGFALQLRTRVKGMYAGQT